MIQLPWPPSVNHYWVRNRNGSMRISDWGLDFRQLAMVACRKAKVRSLDGRLFMHVTAFPPDKRRRDLDNILKAILDAMQHAGAYKDDSQIDVLSITRGQPNRNGYVDIRLGIL